MTRKYFYIGSDVLTPLHLSCPAVSYPLARRYLQLWRLANELPMRRQHCHTRARLHHEMSFGIISKYMW